MTKDRKQHWYKIFIGECPVCGCDASYRVRQYGQKPTDPKKTHILLDHKETYDYCLEREAM